MHPLSTPRYIAKRLVDNWKLLLSVFLGITIAATLTSGAPVYVNALGRIGFLASLERSPPILLNILTSSFEVPIDWERLAEIEGSVEEAFVENVGAIYTGHDRYIKTDAVVMNPVPVLPSPRLALVQEPPNRFGELEGVPSLGHLVNLHDLSDHVEVVRGRLPGIRLGEGDPPGYLAIVEAVVGAQMAHSLGVDVDTTLMVSSPTNPRTRALVHLVGVVEPLNASDGYWQERTALFFGPRPPEVLPEVEFEIDLERPFAAFIINPEAASKLPGGLVQASRYNSSLAYFATATNLGEGVTMLEGRLPTGSVSDGPRGPIIEAMVGVPLASQFGVKEGDVLTLAPYIDETTWVSARIVGVAERTDPRDPYWLWGPSSFFSNPDPEAPPQLPVIVAAETMVGAVAEAHPGSFGKYTRYSYVDPEGFEEWSVREAQDRLQDLEGDLSEVLPAQLTSTGVDGLVIGFERRIFLGSIPLLLLITTMVVTVLYFVSMMVSFLVKIRERDVVLLKTRGIGVSKVLRIYGIEGLVMTLIAVAVAPFLAIGAIALAGKLPYFEGITGGGFLPVQVGVLPFLVAAGTGLLCLAIFVAPSVLGARASMVAHKLRSSRPPSIPFFHRYYLDVGLLVIGGIVFWELQSRGQLVVGGIFGDVEVNETLLVAPVMILIVVALLFLRFFPLVLMYVSGESQAFLHTLSAATLAILVPGIAVRELVDGNMTAWIAPVALLLGFAAAYLMKMRSQSAAYRLAWLLIQVGLVGLFVYVETPAGLLAVPIFVLIALVPAQIAFLLFRAYARFSPVWASMALWRMARNPLQYTWLVLLLVLVAGLATFSYTIGATLQERDAERILYDVAADIRVAKREPQIDGWALREEYSAIPGVDLVSPAVRLRGVAGNESGIPFMMLAVKPQEFSAISWYREDFSTQQLDEVMRALQPYAPQELIAIPAGSRQIGAWMKLGPTTSKLSTQIVVQDSTGALAILPLGEVEREWTLRRADLPTDMSEPLHLAAVRVQARQSLTGIPGSVTVDSIHVTDGDGAEKMLDGFEGSLTWSPLPTAYDASKSYVAVTNDAHGSERAVLYAFEQQHRVSSPGIYQSPSGGTLPVVTDRRFTDAVGLEVGDSFIASVEDALVLMTVSDTVEYFPTMEQRAGGFLLADFDQLMYHLSLKSPNSGITPNELFISLNPGAAREARAQALGPYRLGIDVYDRESLSESFQLDPLVTAGWRGASVVSIVIVGFTALTGIVTYMLFFSDRNRGEMGIVRSLGLAHRQMFILLAFEHLLIVIAGVGLGTWVGLSMSSMMVPLVSLTESGGEVLPPTVVATNWTVICVVYAVLIATFAGILIAFNRTIFKWDLETAHRLEEW